MKINDRQIVLSPTKGGFRRHSFKTQRTRIAASSQIYTNTAQIMWMEYQRRSYAESKLEYQNRLLAAVLLEQSCWRFSTLSFSTSRRSSPHTIMRVNTWASPIKPSYLGELQHFINLKQAHFEQESLVKLWTFGNVM